MNPLLLPLAAIQGRRARSRIEVLPEAEGPKAGCTADSDGSALRAIVIGESTAAGCGARTHEEAFAGAFARALDEIYDQPVCWEVHGRHGANIRRVRYRLLPELDGAADVAVLLIGVNDVLTRTPASQWREDLTAVIEALASLADRVVVAGIPPFDSFPALPRTLRSYLAERGRALDEVAQAVCAINDSVLWMSATNLAHADATFFARDGFHPSPIGYRRWAEEVAHQLTDSPGVRS
ncbi:MAG: SGNH/GDSL hydrolase family protein [Microbacterium sp.]|uniref:SGNH/GDSL hydrolase family protein n=1 Tax=Microbacterium sp. TaxID=51671 RepID=UPI003F9A8B6F